jgi:hypothetical protein
METLRVFANFWLQLFGKPTILSWEVITESRRKHYGMKGTWREGALFSITLLWPDCSTKVETYLLGRIRP